MRTTLTLEPDVAKLLAAVQKRRGLSMKEAVNEALRRGIPLIEQQRKPRAFRTKVVSLGPRTTDVDDVAEVLAEAEGDRFL